MKRYLDIIEEDFLRKARSEILMSVAYGSLREKVASSRFDLWALFRFVPTLEAVCAALPLEGSKLKVCLCCSQLRQVGPEGPGKTFKPGLFLPWRGQNVSVFDHICGVQVAKIDPDVFLPNASDEADVLDHLRHHASPLFLGATRTYITADQSAALAPSPYRKLRSRSWHASCVGAQCPV